MSKKNPKIFRSPVVSLLLPCHVATFVFLVKESISIGKGTRPSLLKGSLKELELHTGFWRTKIPTHFTAKMPLLSTLKQPSHPKPLLVGVRCRRLEPRACWNSLISALPENLWICRCLAFSLETFEPQKTQGKMKVKKRSDSKDMGEIKPKHEGYGFPSDGLAVNLWFDF